jgi:hypothetical protein
MRFAPVVAVLVTAAALYVSRGVLDQVVTETGPVRVALLPPWQALVGFLGLAALGLLVLDRRAAPLATARTPRSSLAFLILPALGLTALLLPYLPFAADVFPALHMLAGPVRGIVWLVVAMQLLWVMWQSRLFTADWMARLTVTHLAIVIAVTTALACGIVAARFTGTVLHPAGDEPHYLVIAQSLWRDGDLKIANNHERRDYAEYYRLALEPHYLTRGADGEIYSIHPIGLPLLMAPIYAAGGYAGVVVAMVLMAAAAAALMWVVVVRATAAVGAATFAWAAIVLTAPFLFNSFTVYPEVAAALAVVVAFMSATDDRTQSILTRWIPVGLACAALPWLSTKYAPMSAALVAVALARIVWPTRDGPRSAVDSPPFDSQPVAQHRQSRVLSAVAVLVPYVVSLAAWFLFFYRIWGSPWPQAP